MSASDPSKGTRRRHIVASEGGPQSASGSQLLSLGSGDWSPSRSVTASPVVEHLALSAGDAFVSSINLCLLLFLRPPWYQEASDDVRSDVVEMQKPSLLYVSLLATVNGLGGAAMKGLVMTWLLSQRSLNLSSGGSSSSADSERLLSADSLGGYCVCPRVVLTLFGSWILVTAALFQLLGAPLESLPSSILLGVFFATVGFLGPYASAVAEGCRSTRWRASERQALLIQSGRTDAATTPPGCSLPQNTGAVVRPLWLRCTVAFLETSLRCSDVLCMPIVFACHRLQTGACRRGSYVSSLHPQELGNLLFFLSVLPLMICCILCLVSCVFLPMDWPTVYIVYPSPLVMFISLGYPLSSFVCFFILLLLPVHCTFPNRYARALPVLQELMLKRSDSSSSKLVEDCTSPQ